MTTSTQQRERTKAHKTNNHIAPTNRIAYSNRIGSFYEDRELRRAEQLKQNPRTKARPEYQASQRSVARPLGSPSVPNQPESADLKTRVAVPKSKLTRKTWQRGKTREQLTGTGNELQTQPVKKKASQKFNQRRNAKMVSMRQRIRRPIDWSVPALMVYFGFLMGVASVVFHGLDLWIAWPFHQASIMYDVVFLICGAILARMSWHTHKEREEYR